LEGLLESFVRSPEKRLSELGMIGEWEKQKLLVEWNGVESCYRKGRNLAGWFEEQVGRDGEAVAVVSGGRRVSYGELNGRANQLGRYLRGKGVGRETLVGLCVERGIEMVVGMLGILKAGGAYVPLDPRYPQERWRFMMQDGGMKVVVSEEGWKGLLEGYEGTAVSLDGAEELIGREDRGNMGVEVVGEAHPPEETSSARSSAAQPGSNERKNDCEGLRPLALPGLDGALAKRRIICEQPACML